jgi:hypothetical protein
MGSGSDKYLHIWHLLSLQISFEHILINAVLFIALPNSVTMLYNTSLIVVFQAFLKSVNS